MSSGPSTILAWWQLLRAGNVFTAISNVMAGFLLVQQSWEPIGPLCLLLLASALLYEAGMVLNDVFDAEVDAAERPERPIPAGRITRRTAGAVGWTLLLSGLAAALASAYLTESHFPFTIAAGLGVSILAYDAGLKKTPLGPWAMGTCRSLNVLLGGSLAAGDESPVLVYALLIGLYTVGLTYFAKSETDSGWRVGSVVGAALVVVAALGVTMLGGGSRDMLPLGIAFVFLMWYGLWASPQGLTPQAKQRTVARLITGFILLDAIAVYGFVGLQEAAAVLALLLPTWIASRFAPMT